jgi:UDP-glucose 4-epimerase
MKRALITGAAGFIGSNLYKRLLEEGWRVTGVDDMSNGYIEFIPEAMRSNVWTGRDFTCDLVIDRVERQEYDVVFHLAALPRVSFSVEQPIITNDVNVSKTLSLMAAARGNVQRIVFASSSSVYGGADILPTLETAPKSPKSPYALQKSIIEDYLKLFHELYGLDSACMRFFNVFGPNQLGSSPYACAIAAWLTAIKSGVPMRSDGDGTQTRDLCYVDNVVDACIRAAEYNKPLAAECFNVACGRKTSNNEIMQWLLRRYPDAKKVDAPWRAGDVMHTLASIDKAREYFEYEPIVHLQDGIERTIKWYDTHWEMIKTL